MRMSSDNQRPLILVALCGGGWHQETCRLLERLDASAYRFAYVYGHCKGVHGAKRLSTPHPGECYPMHYLGPTRKHPVRFVSNPARMLVSCVEAFSIVQKLRPAWILAVGTSMAVPLFAAGRLFGSRCCFIESLTRVDELSLTGRVLKRLGLPHRLYVQWPELACGESDLRYAGAVL